jgi:hypothetical protein
VINRESPVPAEKSSKKRSNRIATIYLHPTKQN